MLLEVRHVTQYHYAEPVRESVMEVWMQPQKAARQRLVSFDLDVDPAAQLFSYADPFGNAVYHFDVPHPHDRLRIVANAAVETQAPPVLPDGLDHGEWDRLRSDFVRGENFDFLSFGGFAVETDALRTYVAEHQLDELRRRDPLNAVRALSDNRLGIDLDPIDHNVPAPRTWRLAARDAARNGLRSAFAVAGPLRRW